MNYQQNEEQERFCLQCGHLLSGRVDQKYCNDNCRNLAGRLKRRKEKWNEPLFISQVNNILKRNYQIIERLLLHEKPRKVSRSFLLEFGFDFRYHTSTLVTKNGTYYFCYCYGWRELEDGKFLLVENDDQANI